MPSPAPLRTACDCGRFCLPPRNKSPIMGTTFATCTHKWVLVLPQITPPVTKHKEVAMAHTSSISPIHPTDRIVGNCPSIGALRAQIRHLAPFDAVGHPSVPTVLLHGETGTGKGLVARIIHDSGPRARGPFLDVNCAAIPEALVEAELFGYEAGAFTDARRPKPGLFEAAAGGTLFLDEIEALPLLLQSKLLKAIEEKSIRRLGAVTEHAVDVKLIAATQADLNARVAGGPFRLDL